MTSDRPIQAELTVTVDDATLSLAAAESEQTTTELTGPGVAGELRLRVRRDRDSNGRDESSRTVPARDTGAGDDPTSGPVSDDSTLDEPAERATSTEAASSDGGAKAHFEVYQDRAEEFRWRLVHDNGNVIADSGEGYATWAGAENGLRSVKRNAPGASVERL